MADGNRQIEFNIPRRAIVSALRKGEIVVDVFAGGGGASEALEQALGRPVDIAINHDEWAVGMHAANHPFTAHHREDVWVADPRAEAAGRPIGWFHASPDCTHFSQARGGQPRSRKTRALSWVAVKWAGTLVKVGNAIRIMSLENVEQILKWGPLVAKRDKVTGRALKMDGTVAARGERVPVEFQQLVPDKKQQGRTWKQFVAMLRRMGYVVEWKVLVASDYGAGTSRKRLFMIARHDGEPIVWPAPTHGKAPGLLPLVTAADSIDFSIPCPSIFTRKKPLADATMRRVARGLKRYVLDAEKPFIVSSTTREVTPNGQDHRSSSSSSGDQGIRDGLGGVEIRNAGRISDDHGRPGRDAVPSGEHPQLAQSENIHSALVTEHANASSARSWPADEPLRTQCASTKGGHFSLVAPSLVPATHHGFDRVNNPSDPLPTITAANRGELMLSAPLLVQAGYGERDGQAPRALDMQKPLGVVTAGGVKHATAAAHLVKFRGDSIGTPATDPVPTITSGAGAARPAGAAHALGVVTAFLEQANGSGPNGNPARARGCDEPVSTIAATGSQQRLVAANMVTMRGTNTGAAADAPVRTLSAGGEHHAIVECTLIPEHEEGALRVAAFLIKYYGTALGVDIDEPLDTITTKDRLALVTVWLHGHPYVVVDIGLRMLRREELFRAQGFPPTYIIDRTADGRPLSISQSVRMVGNSVSPPPLAALARANLDPVEEPMRMAA